MVLNSTMDQTDTGLLKAPRSKCRHFRQARPHGALLGSLIISRRWGTGGTDKPDNPHETRIVGDQGCPHPEQALRERNRPHGTLDGPLIVSMNDMNEHRVNDMNEHRVRW